MALHTVLLVEDDDNLRLLYKENFKKNNFTVYEAPDGQTAIDQAVIQQPQIIILDLMLPRQGGLRALKILRSLPESKHIPIIILTALPNPEYQQEAQNLVQGYYIKTEVTPKALVEKARELLEAV